MTDMNDKSKLSNKNNAILKVEAPININGTICSAKVCRSFQFFLK